MSRHEIDRKSQSNSGRRFPHDGHLATAMRGEGFAAAIAAALHEDFGHIGSAIKTVAAITGANERAVRNWFEAKNGPAGFHLLGLMQHSDRVLEVVLILSGRRQVARETELSALCVHLRDMLSRIEGAIARGRDGP
jgi:hypothetical protein